MKVILRSVAFLLLTLFWVGCSSIRGGGTSEGETAFIPVPSETLYSVRYDSATKDLTVVQRNGDVFDYLEVPPEVYDGLLQNAEPDAFFRDRIASEFKSRKVEF